MQRSQNLRYILVVKPEAWRGSDWSRTPDSWQKITQRRSRCHCKLSLKIFSYQVVFADLGVMTIWETRWWDVDWLIDSQSDRFHRLSGQILYSVILDGECHFHYFSYKSRMYCKTPLLFPKCIFLSYFANHYLTVSMIGNKEALSSWKNP